jgi:hypothetical protein
MSKFNTATTRATGVSPITSDTTPSGVTYEGRLGYARDAKSELFLLAVTNMVGEDTFYEGAGERDTRFRDLVRTVAVEDADWLARFLPWLRGEANMRSAPVVAALEGAKVLLDVGNPGGRQLVDSVLRRPDEPGEALAYWTSNYGKRIPKPVKRGIADAVTRLYNERSLIKYDTATKGFRFGDVIDLVHPSPSAPWQGALFEHALDRRHNRDKPVPEALELVRARATLLALPVEQRRAMLRNPEGLASAGFTWEALAGWLQGPMDAEAWQAVIPSMGYMALLRNLRNFDEAGVPDEVAAQVAVKLADPEQVARSRQFPFRFYAAHNAVSSLRWGFALEKALHLSLANVPTLPGRTLILIDQSPSMFPGWSMRQTYRDINNADLAKLFGSAVALRAADATLVGYGHANYRVQSSRGEAVLHLMGKFRQESGTDAYGAAFDHFDGHDRIVVVTDGENNGHRFRSFDEAGVPRTVPIYTWNIGGYRLAQYPDGPFRHTFGGLSDAAFRMIPLIEAGKTANWPF